jgi:hypothetical protein
MTRAVTVCAAGGALVALVCSVDGTSGGALNVYTPKVVVRPPTPHVQVNSYSPGGLHVPTVGGGTVSAGTRNGTSAAFQLDRTSGTVQFGNGTAGQVPPAGSSNVTRTYRTGRGGDHRR